MLNNEENIEFVNFPDFGRQTSKMASSTLEGGTRMGMNIRKSIRQYMSSKGKLQFELIISSSSYHLPTIL